MRQTTLLISRESIGQISHAPLLDHFEFALNIRAYSPDILIISIINSLQETSCPIDEKRHYQLIARIIVNIFLRHLFDIIYEQEAKHDKCDEILIKNKQMLARLNQNKIYEHCLDLLMKCEHPSAYTLMELLYNFKDKIFDLDAMRARNGTTYFYRKQEKMHDSWQLSEFSNLFLGGIPNQKTKVTLSWRLFISDLSKEYLIKLSLFLDFCQGAIDKPEDAKILNYIRRKLSTKLRLTQDGAEYLESLAGYSAKDFHHPGFNYRELQHVANRLPIFITEFLKSPNGMGCLNQEMIVCRIKEELSYHSDREINQDSPIQKDPNYLPIKETTTYYKARQKYLY